MATRSGQVLSASCIGAGRSESAPFPPCYGMPSAICPTHPSFPLNSHLCGTSFSTSPLSTPSPFASYSLGLRRIETPLRALLNPPHPLTTSRPQNTTPTRCIPRFSSGYHLLHSRMHISVSCICHLLGQGGRSPLYYSNSDHDPRYVGMECHYGNIFIR